MPDQTGTGNIGTAHDLERRLESFPGAATVLRAANFAENWGWVLDPVLERGVLPSLLQPLDRKSPTQSAQDVGTVAADLMAEGGPSRRLVELHGPEDASPEDAAAALADLLGKPVTAVAPPEAAWPGIFRGQGFPLVTVEAFCTMYRAFNAGLVAFEGTHETRHGSTGLREALARLLGARAGGPHVSRFPRDHFP